jgi:hypothetical protein
MIAFLAVVACASAQQLDLSLEKIEDISALGFVAVGGADYDSDTGHLWMSERISQTGFDNMVAEFDPVSGQIHTTFDASVVPGLTNGPGALAVHPRSGNIFAFSSFKNLAGEVTQAGTLVKTLAGDYIDAAAFNSRNELYVLRDPPPAGNGKLHRLNQATGEIETTVSISGYSGAISSMDFDPARGRLFVYADPSDALLEVDLESGDVVSTTSLQEFFALAQLPFGFPNTAGFAFNEDGTRLFISRGDDYVSGAPVGGEVLLVLNRQVPDCFLVASVTDLGNGLPGTFGITPQLIGGVSTDLCVVQLVLLAVAQSNKYLVVGLDDMYAPFKGGVMVPEPALIVANPFTGGGQLTVYQPGVPIVGVTLVLQVWCEDQFGPSGYSASNGLSLTVH